MTVGKLIDEFFAFIKNLPFKEYLNEGFDMVKRIPQNMHNNFTELISADAWGWVFTVIFWILVAVIVWKSLEPVGNFIAESLIYVAFGILGLMFLFCIYKGKIDVAVILLLLLIVMLVWKFFFKKA